MHIWLARLLVIISFMIIYPDKYFSGMNDDLWSIAFLMHAAMSVISFIAWFYLIH